MTSNSHISSNGSSNQHRLRQHLRMKSRQGLGDNKSSPSIRRRTIPDFLQRCILLLVVDTFFTLFQNNAPSRLKFLDSRPQATALSPPCTPPPPSPVTQITRKEDHMPAWTPHTILGPGDLEIYLSKCDCAPEVPAQVLAIRLPPCSRPRPNSSNPSRGSSHDVD